MHASRLSLSLLAAFLVATPAVAQKGLRTLLPGATVNGTLERGDPTASDGSYYDLWTVRAAAGDVFTLTLRSRDFDAFLAVGQMSDGDFESIKNDDDGAGGTDAKLTFTAPRAGEYLVRANTLSEGETGAYTLSLESSAGGGVARAGAAQPISLGQTVNGALTSSDPKREDDDTYYDDYRFQGRAGQQVSITLRSSDFDAWLVLGRGTGTSFESMESDDDSAGGTDSRIEMTLPESGEYVIRANALSSSSTGAYSVTLSSGGAGTGTSTSGGDAIPAAMTSISLGQTLGGQLTSSDPTLPDDSYYDAFRFQGRAGQRVTITLRSSAFDAYLSVDRIVGGELVNVESDDDGAGGTDSQLTITLPETGDYLIRANSLRARATGAYTVTLASGS